MVHAHPFTALPVSALTIQERRYPVASLANQRFTGYSFWD
jgi:hypothetical protein